MTKRKPLGWYETPDGGLVPLCATCMDAMTPALVEACASVGIEHGKSTGQMMVEYLNTYHARRHDLTRS